MPEPPAAAIVWLVGAIEKVHGAAACVTVKVWAATVAVPVRAGPGLAAMFRFTGPAPVPVAPESIVIHGTFAAVVHAHDPPVVTAIVDEPPAAGIASPDGLIE